MATEPDVAPTTRAISATPEDRKPAAVPETPAAPATSLFVKPTPAAPVAEDAQDESTPEEPTEAPAPAASPAPAKKSLFSFPKTDDGEAA